jgi:hypothetical protein
MNDIKKRKYLFPAVIFSDDEDPTFTIVCFPNYPCARIRTRGQARPELLADAKKELLRVVTNDGNLDTFVGIEYCTPCKPFSKKDMQYMYPDDEIVMIEITV